MLVMGQPQFRTQDDMGLGDGIPPIPEWQLDSTGCQDDSFELPPVEVDDIVRNVFTRLRSVFRMAQSIPLTPTRLHDLTCFVIHRLLLSAPDATSADSSPPMTECIRYAIVLYMFIIQGPTYFSHVVIFNMIVNRLMHHLGRLEFTRRAYDSLDVWLHAVGLAASARTAQYPWFTERAGVIASFIPLSSWNEVLVCLKSVLWLDTPQGQEIFQPHWDAILNGPNQPGLSRLTAWTLPGSAGSS
jgi:hypothetical protein